MDEKYNKDKDCLVENESFISWVKNPTEASKSIWESWVLNNPHRKEEFKNAKTLIQSLNFKKDTLDQKDVASLLSNIHGEIGERRQKPLFRFVYKYAAAVLLGIVVVAGYIYINNLPKVVFTNSSEKESITLSDGSQVVLNGSSSLKFQENWKNNDIREVWLEGEAFFDITSQPLKGTSQFIVHTSDFDVEVLGTKFQVSDQEIKPFVILEEGKVSVTKIGDSPNAETTMKPGDMVAIETHKITKTQNINTDIFTSWKKDVLVFDNTPLRQVIEILENSFDYNVIMKGIDSTILDTVSISGAAPNDALIKALNAIISDKEIAFLEKRENTLELRVK